MYSCNKYNIFARKSRTNCLEVNSKGYMEFEQPSRAHFQRYPLLQQILMGVVRGIQFPLLYSASGTAGIVKQCQILMESEMFRREKHNYSISLNPFKQLKTKWRMTWDGVRKLKAKKRPGKERKSLAKSKFQEFGSFGGSQSDCVSVIKSYGEEISKMRLTQLQELRLKVF